MHICIWVFVPWYTASMGDILIHLCTNTLSSDVFYSHISYLCSSVGQGNALIFYFQLSTCGSLCKLNSSRVVVSLDESSAQPPTRGNDCFTLGKGTFRYKASFDAGLCCAGSRRIPIIALIYFRRILSLSLKPIDFPGHLQPSFSSKPNFSKSL
jgi:hypothetical protein